MKKHLSSIFLISGLIMAIFGFFLKEEQEKEIYRLYLKDQEKNLLAGFENQWKNLILKEAENLQGYGIIVDRSGKLVSPKKFFPKKESLKLNWRGFDYLSKDKKKAFLDDALKKDHTWDRIQALKRLDQKPSNLSPFEETFFSDEAKKAYELIYAQVKKVEDYSSSQEKLVKKVMIIPLGAGKIKLFVPRKKWLQNNLLNTLKSEVGTEEIVLDDNFLKLKKVKGATLVQRNGSFNIGIFSLSFLFIVFGVLSLRKEAREKELEALRKVSFLNQLVHEVKTPITSIKLNSDLLKKHGFDRELIESLSSSCMRLDEFFNDIVLINQKSQTSKPVKMSEEEFQKYLTHLFSEFEGRMTSNLKAIGDVSIDQARFRIVLRNLIKNAIRYGKKAEVSLFKEKESLVVHVLDQGEGVKKEDSEKIFSEFYRAKEARNLSPDGLGIGLNISKKLTSEMQGSLRLLNPGEKGALFELRIKTYES